MACTGTCHLEQHEWREDRIEDNPYNGAPYRVPGAKDERVPAGKPDEEIWRDQDLGAFSEYVLFENIDFHGSWADGVDRQHPREGRQLDCKEEGCRCRINWEKPTILEDWSQETRYVVHVRHVYRWKVDSEPGEEHVERFLLKGAILHRKRILQGICSDESGKPIVPPFAPRRRE